MQNTILILEEHQWWLHEEKRIHDFQRTITTWLTTQLNTHSTNDACAVLPAQAFQINSYQPAAHKV